MTSLLMSPHDLRSLTAPLVIIDTRDADAYRAGHIPGAVNMRDIFTYLATSDPSGLAELATKFAALFGAVGLSGSETAVIYEDAMNTGYGQSCRGYFLLRSLGYSRVCVLHGGYRAWLAAGLPVSTEVPVVAPQVFPLKPAFEQFMVTKDDMLAALSQPDIRILDVRDRDEWEGLSSSPYGVDFCPRKGRIPGAVWIEWYRLMEEPEGGPAVFRSKAAIREACAEVGITASSEVYVYCFKGARASNSLVALHEAGIPHVKVYFGSWNEWSRDPALPIVPGAPVSMMPTGDLADALSS